MRFQNTYKVVVVEDEEILLNNLILKIGNSDPLLKVVGAAKNGKEALSVIESVKPDILFTDVIMPVMDGLELIVNVKKNYPNIQIVIVSAYSEFHYIQKALKLGVNDYLLKPVKTDSLIETINSVKSKLEALETAIERDIIYSYLRGNPIDDSLPYSINNGRFSLLLISIGNIFNNVISNNSLAILNTIWNNVVDWDELLRPLLSQDEKWWVIDDNHQNQKFILLSSNDDKNTHTINLLQKAKEKLEKIAEPFSVNICIEADLFSYTEIWTISQKLRQLLKQTLVIGKSSIITTNPLEDTRNLPTTIDSNTKNKLLTFLKSNNIKFLKKELYTLFDRWLEFEYPQDMIENALFKLLDLFYTEWFNDSENELPHIKYVLSEKLTLISNLKYMYDDIWNIFYSLYPYERNTSDHTKELSDRIAKYLGENYMQPQSMEDISQKFSFNASYLTKIFKKHKGDSPLRYLINLRIGEAKRLIKLYPEMGLKEIGEIVGYYDQHYFSRIFKNISGLTLSEYKEKVNK